MDDGTIDALVLKGAVMSASAAMAITDPHQPDNPIIFTNPAFSQITGYGVDEVRGRNCRFLQGAGTDPTAVAAIHAALMARREIQIDILNYRRDGSPFTNRLYVSPVLDQRGGLVHFFASQFDATAAARDQAVAKRREEVLRYLASDLSHRLNSTIDVVQALVTNALTSAASVVEAGSGISARLMALGQLHSKISQDDWEDEDFGTLVAQVIQPFRGTFATLDVYGPPLRLPALISLKLSSVVYELCLQAHQGSTGAKSDRAARIAWSLGGDSGSPVLRFEWVESGSRDLDLAARKTLHRALTLIMSDPRADIAVQTHNDRGALTCRVTLPEG